MLFWPFWVLRSSHSHTTVARPCSMSRWLSEIYHTSHTYFSDTRAFHFSSLSLSLCFFNPCFFRLVLYHSLILSRNVTVSLLSPSSPFLTPLKFLLIFSSVYHLLSRTVSILNSLLLLFFVSLLCLFLSFYISTIRLFSSPSNYKIHVTNVFPSTLPSRVTVNTCKSLSFHVTNHWFFQKPRLN